MSLVETAKEIKKEIIDKYPNLKVSVRTERFSNGNSIDVAIKECDFNPLNPNQNPYYTEKGIGLLKEIQKIMNQHENHYYKFVEYDYDFIKKCREENLSLCQKQHQCCAK